MEFCHRNCTNRPIGDQVTDRLRSDADSRNRVSVRAVNSLELNPDQVYDGFFICLGFSPEIPDSEGLTIFWEHTRYNRDLPPSPVILTRGFARLSTTVAAFRAGTPAKARQLRV